MNLANNLHQLVTNRNTVTVKTNKIIFVHSDFLVHIFDKDPLVEICNDAVDHMRIVQVRRRLASKQVLRQPLFKVIMLGLHDTEALGHALDPTSQDKLKTAMDQYAIAIQCVLNAHFDIGQKLDHGPQHRSNEVEALCLVLVLFFKQAAAVAAVNPGQHSHKDLEITVRDVRAGLNVQLAG